MERLQQIEHTLPPQVFGANFAGSELTSCWGIGDQEILHLSRPIVNL